MKFVQFLLALGLFTTLVACGGATTEPEGAEEGMEETEQMEEEPMEMEEEEMEEEGAE